MEQHETTSETPSEVVFEGGDQETVEILPDIRQLSARQREEGVVARVGTDRPRRQIAEGAPPPPDGSDTAAARARVDALLAVTYQLAGYFTLAITGVIAAVVVAWVVTANVGS